MFYPFQNPGSRRTFVKRLGGVLAALATSSWANVNLNDPDPSKKSQTMNLKTVTNVRRLGFQWDTADPFLFCVHHEDFFPKGNGKLGPDAALLKGRDIGQDFTVKDGFRMYHGSTVPGFPEHPHRGFETVTVVQRGMVDHADSQGAAGRYGGGDTQWMTAGGGILHIETPPEHLVMSGGLFHGFQLWVNLPAAKKWSPPAYQDVRANDVALLSSTDGGALIRIIAGELDGHFGPGTTQTPITLIHATIQPGAELRLPWNPNFNALVYTLSGHGYMGSEKRPVQMGQLTTFVDGDVLVMRAAEVQESRSPYLDVFILGGEPIRESVAWMGPFVMNTKREVLQAFEDFQKGLLGIIPKENKKLIRSSEDGSHKLGGNAKVGDVLDVHNAPTTMQES